MKTKQLKLLTLLVTILIIQVSASTPQIKKGAQVLMELARTTFKALPRPKDRVIPLKMPSDANDYIPNGTNATWLPPLWSLERSTNLRTWEVIRVNQSGWQSTNYDIFRTNGFLVDKEYFRMRRQTNWVNVPVPMAPQNLRVVLTNI